MIEVATDDREKTLDQIDNCMHRVFFSGGAETARIGRGEISWHIEYAIGQRIDYDWIIDAFLQRRTLIPLPPSNDYLYVSKSLRGQPTESYLASGEEFVRILNRHNIGCWFDPSERSIKFNSWRDMAEAAQLLAKR